MSAILPVVRPAYFAPTRRRHFFTGKAAARAEATALIVRKYPTEKGCVADGDPGWHWTEDERLQRACDRLTRNLYRHLKARK